MISFKCNSCGETHQGTPTFGWTYPVQYLSIPKEEREQRISLGTDDCVIDEKHFFIRGCLEIPVIGESEPFAWGVWVSLSKENFTQFIQYFGNEKRAHIGPFFGWLCSDIWLYPTQTLNLKTQVHLRDNMTRPYIELERTSHPLAIEQREGVSVARIAEIYEKMTHPEKFI